MTCANVWISWYLDFESGGMYLVSGDDLGRADRGHEGAAARESGAEDLAADYLFAALIEADVLTAADSSVARGVDKSDTSQANLYRAHQLEYYERSGPSIHTFPYSTHWRCMYAGVRSASW